MKLSDTPIEKHYINKKPVDVKREDLCAIETPNAPPFSKVRGLDLHLKKIAKQGFSTVVYVETSISMAGWGVAALAPYHGLKAIIFDPQYNIDPKQLKNKPHLKILEYHRIMWRKFNATIIPIKAGRAKVNYYIARRYVNNKIADNKGVLLPLGLPLQETIEATKKIANKIANKNYYSTVVINVGSGTVCKGVLKGFEDSFCDVIGIMGRSGKVTSKGTSIQSAVPLVLSKPAKFKLIDSGYQYTQKSLVTAPFPCHPYYDLKAWEWLTKNIDTIEPPVLFWNIGSMPKEVEI